MESGCEEFKKRLGQSVKEMNSVKIEEIIKDENILNLYTYGSVVYNTNNEKSDLDFIAIVIVKKEEQVILDNINISFYTVEEFKEKLDNHEISAIECLFLPDDLILKKTVDFGLSIDKHKLHCECSKKASNSFVKAKKKIKDGHIYIGQKSLFHSIRIIDFAIQIIKHGKIVDYSSQSQIFKLILDENPNTVVEKFKATYNLKKSELRRLEGRT